MSSRSPDSSTTQRTALSSGPPAREQRATACLVVIQGERMGQRMDIGDAPIVIGRSPDADFPIPHRSISRSHCRIWREGGGYRIKDLDSTNKTFLNDRPVIEAELKDGDHITLGENILKFIGQSSVEARYHEELYQLATEDPLTELCNRRRFLELLDKDYLRIPEQGRPLSLLLLDIDHFKAINDRYGHPAGDAVLRSIGAALRRYVNSGNLIARIGGEEFAVALPERNLTQAVAFAEVLRVAVMGTEVLLDGKRYPITTSVGAAQWSEEMRVFDDLFRAADSELYRAKSAGRNRVSWPGLT